MFSIPCVKAVRGDEGAAIVFNECLLRLMHLRKHQIAAEGDDEHSHTAWKLAAFQQGILYRVVMLAQGGSNGWNESNILSSILCARALLETIAKMHYLEIHLAKHLDTMDIKAISELLDGQIFSTRNDEWLEDGAVPKATNVLTNKLDKVATNTKNHYIFLSDWCHPNWVGQQFLFATTDAAKKITTFSESKGRNKNTLDAVFGALMMIKDFEYLLAELDAAIAIIADTSRETPKASQPDTR